MSRLMLLVGVVASFVGPAVLIAAAILYSRPDTPDPGVIVLPTRAAPAAAVISPPQPAPQPTPAPAPQPPDAPSPVAATPPPSPPPASAESTTVETFELFDGGTVRVNTDCVQEKHLDERRTDAIRLAKPLPQLKQAALDTEVAFDQFLDAHPEKELAPAAFRRYERLRKAYEQALGAYNDKIDELNRFGQQYNADLESCRVR